MNIKKESKVSDRLKVLHHACVVYTCADGTKIAIDPWDGSPIFDGGWVGNQRLNKKKFYKEVASCNFLWISHPHADHLHLPSLRAICAINPNITVLCNEALNVPYEKILKSAGFKNFVKIPERKKIKLTQSVSVLRVPASGIDNMLFVYDDRHTLLSYNDCNIPAAALRSIVNRYGPIDLFLTNINHAGILRDQSSNAIMHKAWIDHLVQRRAINYNSNRRYAIRFIGMDHSYTFATDQNLSLWRLAKNGTELIKNRRKVKSTAAAVWSHESLINEKANEFYKKIRYYFYGCTPGLGFAWIEDCIKTTDAHLLNWFTKPGGTEAFFIGANFSYVSNDAAVDRYGLYGRLIDQGLSPRHIVDYGLKFLPFLWNRREEIWALLRSGSWRKLLQSRT